MNEIERKFLAKELPQLDEAKKIEYERYYIYNEGGIELRIQRKNDHYELERKEAISDLARDTQKLSISKAEFDILKSIAAKGIVRDSYKLDDYLSLKVYKGEFDGLVRAEIEFPSIEDAEQFEPLEWFGQEITDSPLGRDGRLLTLSQDEFKQLIATSTTRS